MSNKHFGVTNMIFNDDNDNTKYLLTDASEVKPFTFPDKMDNMGTMYPVDDVQVVSK